MNYRNSTLLSISLLPFLSASLAQTPQSNATLTVTNSSDHEITLYAYKNPSDCSGGSVAFEGSKLLRPGEHAKLELPPSALFSFFVNYNFLAGNSIKYCNMPATFTPQSGQSYVVLFDSSSAGCTFDMKRSDGSETSGEEAFRLREWRQPFASKGPFCKLEP